MKVYVVQYIAPLGKNNEIVGVCRSEAHARNIAERTYQAKMRTKTVPPLEVEIDGSHLGPIVRINYLDLQA